MKPSPLAATNAARQATDAFEAFAKAVAECIPKLETLGLVGRHAIEDDPRSITLTKRRVVSSQHL